MLTRQVNGEKSADDLGLVSYQVNNIMEHVPFQAKESDIRNSPRLGDEVEFDLAQVKRTKDHIALNIRIVQRAHSNSQSAKGSDATNGDTTVKNGDVPHQNGDSAKIHKGFVASLKDTFGFIETVTHDKEIFFHYRYDSELLAFLKKIFNVCIPPLFIAILMEIPSRWN